ncbi:conserved hypothetical protein [Ruegeria lacuscaerulensis ITI-1157]|nr:conserved hypothetical protein [Ruegeria lacuscaerulensis ITI-1157]SHK24537.1 hypothetical protein SAMN05444404_3556 [Ruegeria lacuscaerulensis ITI-1157]
MRKFGLSLIAALALTAPAHALTLPSGGKLSFDVVRKGKDIGDHVYRFQGNESDFTVKVVTDISVKVPLIRATVYSFNHDSTEVWKGGKLQHLTSKTDDDGTPHQLDTGATGVLPASLWNEDTVRSKKLLNTIDGKIMKVRVADLGEDRVETRSGVVAGHHYKISGGLERDLWYDASGNLARVSFKAEDGSTVTYVRK